MKPLNRLFGYLKSYWVAALLAPVFMALEVAMDLCQPRLLQTIVDVGIAQHKPVFVLHTGLLMIGAAMIGMLGGIGCTIAATIASINLGTSIRADLFRKIQRFSFGNLDRLEPGGLITRLTNDVDQVQEASLMLLRAMVRSPLLAIGSLIMAVITSPSLSLLLLVLGPIIMFLLIVVNRRAHPLFLKMQERLDAVNTIAQENFAGVRVVKAFVRSRHEIGRFGEANEQLCEQTIRASALVAGILPMLVLLLEFGIIAVIWFGGVEVKHGTLHLGQVLAFINYLLQMLAALMMLGMLMMRITRAEASAERIIEVLDSDPTVQDSAEATIAPKLSGRIEFANVSFSYGEESSPTLAKISFNIEPGQTVAILGATGSGKSTLIHLIPRLYDVTAGRVLIDAVDVRDMTQETLRRQVSVVMQETILFSGTIAENLRYGRPDASDADIAQAAQMACAHDFIVGFPDGYETIVGQCGVNLSGGQKQRLAIARALVARPAILLMDDCTSSVDMTTEASIVRAINEWDHSCTRIVVAQRISSVVDADKILVIEDGALAAQGTHSQLLQSSVIYQNIVRSQLGEEAHSGN